MAYREREREREIHICGVCIYIYTHFFVDLQLHIHLCSHVHDAARRTSVAEAGRSMRYGFENFRHAAKFPRILHPSP